MSKKVLLVNTEIKTASTGKITYQFYQEMKKRGYNVVAAFGAKQEEMEKDFYCLTFRGERTINRKISEWTGFPCGGSFFSTWRLIRLIKIMQPDVIHLFNLHGFYINEKMLFSYIKKRQCNVVYNMLDEYPYLGSCCYAYECENYCNQCKKCVRDKHIYPVTRIFKRGHQSYQRKYKAYGKYENIVFTGPQWVIERAQRSSVLREQKLEVVDEFVDTANIFYPRETGGLRKKLGISENRVILLDVAPLSNPRKGVKYFYELAEKVQDKKYVFVHVGYNVPDITPPQNVITIPYVGNQDELAEYYSLADLFVCTSVADTMPNVCLDSLACGTPVCGFDITGIPFVSEEPLGRFVKAGDVEALKNIVLKTEAKDEVMSRECRKYAEKRYTVEIFSEKMEEIYRKYFWK